MFNTFNKIIDSVSKPESGIESKTAIDPELVKLGLHPEASNFDPNKLKEALEKEATFKFSDNSELAEIEKFAIQSDIETRVEKAKETNSWFLHDFKRGVSEHEKSLEVKPVEDFERMCERSLEGYNEKLKETIDFKSKLDEGRMGSQVRHGNIFLLFKEGTLHKVTFNVIREGVDLNNFGFPGALNIHEGKIVLDNNAGDYKNNNKYLIAEIKKATHSMSDNRGNFYAEPVVYDNYSVEKISPAEAKDIVGPEKFSLLFEEIKSRL
jgi:hypothetical protein